MSTQITKELSRIDTHLAVGAKHRVRIVREDKHSTATILDDKLSEDFAGLVEEGIPIDAICDYLGLETSTFWDWKRKGEHYHNSGQSPPRYAVFGEFVRQLRRASAVYRITRVRKLHNSKTIWVREMAILERRDKASFSRKEPPGGSLESYDPDEKFM